MWHSGSFFDIVHQVFRSLDSAVKILYHLVACQKLWSEVNHHVKSDFATAKVRVLIISKPLVMVCLWIPPPWLVEAQILVL